MINYELNIYNIEHSNYSMFLINLQYKKIDHLIFDTITIFFKFILLLI